MTTTPLLSIVIPTYTRSKMLIETLESLRNQSYLPIDKIEVIISNDCSKDDTIEVVESYTKQYINLPIRMVTQKQNLKGPGNWKFCQHEAKGTYLFLLSDDDQLHVDFLKEYLSILENNNQIDLIFSGFIFCDKDMKELSKKQLTPHIGEHKGVDALYQQLNAHHMAMSSIYKREIFNQYSGWSEQYGVHLDCSAFCLHALHSQKAYYINKPLFKYRILPDSWASFDANKQGINYQHYRNKIDNLIKSSSQNNISLENDLHIYYLKHAKSILNALEIKYANNNIKGSEIREVIKSLLDIFPEGKGSSQHFKLFISSYIGLSWLKVARKLFNKTDPYQSQYKHFEECK